MNRTIIRFVFLMTSVTGGCVDAKDEPALNKEQMVPLLSDVRILEGLYAARYERMDSVAGTMAALYDSVFKVHNTDKVTFEKAYKWYAVHPDALVEVEEAVLENLNRRIADVREQQSDVYRGADSTTKKP
jgi:hypothetical protein